MRTGPTSGTTAGRKMIRKSNDFDARSIKFKIQEDRMLKITNKICLSILTLIYVLLVILLGLIIVLSITGPQNNLFPWQMAIGTTLGTILLLGAFFLWGRIPHEKVKQSSLLYAALLILFGISLYAVSFANRNAIGYNDYAQIWNAALEISEGKPVSDEFYFKTYANNIKPMLYLSILFRAAKFLRFSDPFYFVLLLSVLEVLGAVWSVGILIGNTAEEHARYRIPVLFMFVFSLPIWANVQAFYTDSMSFVMSIISLALFKLCLEAASRFKSGLLLTLAGIFTGLGMSIKITVLIPIIAGFIIFGISRPSLKRWCLMGTFLLCSGAAYGLTSLYAEGFPLWEAAKETSEPVINWIALGMKGEGSWSSNPDYILYVTTLPTKQEKTQYTLRYIWENRSDFWNLSHLFQKLRFNFASGHLGTKDFTYWALKEHNLVWELFSPWGKHYWRTSQLCFCFIFSIYTVYLLGAATTLRRLIKKREIHGVKAVADLSLLGIILFLMVWEANNRQLYNQLPVIILGAVLNIRLLVSGKIPSFFSILKINP